MQNKNMPNSRRDLIKMIALSGMGIAGIGLRKGFSSVPFSNTSLTSLPSVLNADDLSIIGAYGKAVSEWKNKDLPSLSFRRPEWSDVEEWKKIARKKLSERIGIPNAGGLPQVTVNKQYEYDGLHIEEISWQLPYGSPTQAILLKPANAKGPLPGILAFHDHGGDKYFGVRKITRAVGPQHPLMATHQQKYYGGQAWANELAKRGYTVLVSDAFAFGSRRVLLKDVPAPIREGLDDNDPENPDRIKAYNHWAAQHEHIMAKSLFSAGTTWPGMFVAEDQKALDILCARKDVDAKRIGCGGLSGGGIRTVYMGGLDPRIKCAVCVGFMTTWDDFILHKSFAHTWMAYAPLLPLELEFSEILGLRVPLATLVLNDNEDDLFTVSEMKKAAGVLSEIYQKAGKVDRFKCSFYPGEHKFDKNMQSEAFNWFDKWLKN